MKLFFASAALMFTVVAHASPKVGDYSEFQLTVSQNGQQMVGSYTTTIVSEAGDQMTVSSTVHFDGRPDQVTQETRAKSDLLSDEQIAGILSNCAQYGGVTEQTVVLAGTYATCKIPTMDDANKQNGTVWVGAVSFGVVKQTQTNASGQTYTLDLKANRNGQ